MGVECSSSFVRFRFRGGKPANDYGKLPLNIRNKRRTDRRSSEIYLSRRRLHLIFDSGKRSGRFARAHTSKGDRQTAAVRMSLQGSKRAAIRAFEPKSNISNYYQGRSETLVNRGPPLRAVSYKNVYSGIDVVYYGNQRQLEYDFVVSPGANPKDIRLSLTARIASPLPPTVTLASHPYGEFASESLSFIRM